MDVPTQIAFHKADKPDWVEGEIRARVDKLSKMEPQIVGCRITVDQRAENSEHTVPPVVRIELDMPGTAPVIVAYEPERLQSRYQRPDMRTAINDAFGLAERKLEAWKEHRQTRTKDAHHDSQNQFLGQVAELEPESDHAFLMTKEGGLLYFHRSSMLSGDFDSLRLGDAVHYVEDVGDTGPIATKVRPA
ncbi:MAG TPA: HPF/RaiA family ribosome-associated protein [Pararhizobium sp.]|nr:HPF/RaiA family ribosome-associated protein [Pararhizobium sp.]